MDRVVLHADDRTILGKKVKNLRNNGQLPAHIFGKKVDTEHVSVDTKEFMKVYIKVGETGLVDLKLGTEKIRPVLIREVQYDPVSSKPLHIDFYQVNLLEKVKVFVPIELTGSELEKVHLGEAIVLQTVSEVEVEALPTDLIEKIEVDVSTLKEIGDVVTASQLDYDHSKITVLADPEEIVVKLDTAVSAETEALLAEQAAEVAVVAEETVADGSEVEGVVKEADEGEVKEAEEKTEEKPE